MACFQTTIQLCFLLSLADYLHTRGEGCVELTKSTCGRQAVISCNIPGMILESVCPVIPVNRKERAESDCLSRENSTSSDGRLQLSMSGSTVELHFRPAKLGDQGSYQWFFQGNERHSLLRSVLTIEETSEEPSISVEEEDLNVVCKAVGGCPEQIHWRDSNGKTWTQSATFEEKADAITSTLLLQGSTNQTVYYCTVTYRQLNKTSNATKSITIPGSTTSEESKDPQKATTPDFIAPVLTVLLSSVIVAICLICLIWLRSRRPDIEGAIQAEEYEEEQLQGTPSI
ncbi:uncharacterized protein [Ambystoma mexicanum]|uniref:uncharacterized protein isoform X2 n=1 Tax=Ambystoma mexicanum TaxID=8296 RepID=UPI0037E75CF0